MKIDTLVLGMYQNNSYVLRKDERHADCIIIDTGLDSGPLIDFLEEKELKPAAVLLTHGHADHTAGLWALKEHWPDVKVAVHEADADMVSHPQKNMSALAGMEFAAPKPDILLKDGAVVEYAGISLEVLHTPGHTPGGACFYSAAAGVAFAGDTIFAGSVGRTDFPYGNTAQLLKSISEKLLALPETTRIYSGHGPATTIRNEKRHNPYLNTEI
jgi:hydroxyacylglutathione hydrolase